MLSAFLVSALVVGGLLAYARWYGGTVSSADGACRVSYVYDGDTVAVDCGTVEHRARLDGLDTPETRDAGCAEEEALGRRATARLRQLVARGKVTFHRTGTDKYDRPLIRLFVDDRDVADTLVDEGLAVAYDGGQRPDWCARLGGG